MIESRGPWSPSARAHGPQTFGAGRRCDLGSDRGCQRAGLADNPRL